MPRRSARLQQSLLKKHQDPQRGKERSHRRQSRFTYTPLEPGTIRLLAPTTSHQADGHAWELRVVQIDDQDVQFDALSYIWGSTQKQYFITINGKQFLVHANLYSALPYLARRRDCEKRSGIWIDAICINQSDEAEKLCQIRLMSKIYRQAERVWAWLGIADEQERIPDAIVALESIADGVESIIPDLGKRTIASLRNIKEETQRRLGNPSQVAHLDPKFWSAITHILYNSWFRRVWIVQEAALAKEITFFCGQYEIDSKLLHGATTMAFFWKGKNSAQGNHVGIDRKLFYALRVFKLRQVAQRKQDKSGSILMDISYWMAEAENECALPEDRIRGIEGFCVDQDLLDSFQTHTSIVELYTKFSIELVIRNYARSLFWNWLSLAFTHTRLDGLPSWVPDFHHQTGRHKCTTQSISACGVGTTPKYEASTRISLAKKGDCWNEIVIEGIVLDKISLVLPELSRESLDNGNRMPVIQELTILAKWEASVAQTMSHRLLSQDCTDQHQMCKNHLCMNTYWRTLIADVTEIGTGSITVHTYLEFQACMNRLLLETIRREINLQGISSGSHSSEAELPEAIARSFTENVGNFKVLLRPLWGRQLFLTEGGRFGFTSRGVRVGDQVCVLNGAPTPHVLRRASHVNGRERWSFVGDAYVHGLMNGEVDTMGTDPREIVLV